MTCLVSCQVDSNHLAHHEAINEVIGELLDSHCDQTSKLNSDSEIFIVLSDSIFEFNYNFKNFQFQNFNLDSFINKSKNLDYDISNIPKED